MHTDDKVMHTEEIEEMGGSTGAEGEGCRVVVAELKVSERGCYMWCQVEYVQLEGNDYLWWTPYATLLPRCHTFCDIY